MKLRLKGLAITACILLAGLFCFCGDDITGSGHVDNTSYYATEDFSFRLLANSVTGLRLESINGDVNIVGDADSDSVIVTGVKRVGSYSYEDAEEHLPYLDVSLQNLGNEIYVWTDLPRHTEGRSYRVDFDISLPRFFENNISIVNGSLGVDSFDNDLSATVANGNVILDEIYGSAFVDLANGNMVGRIFLPLNGTIDLDVINGNISLNIPQDISTLFFSSVVIGTISISNLDLHDQQVTSGSVIGVLGQGEGITDLDAINGNIVVTGF